MPPRQKYQIQSKMPDTVIDTDTSDTGKIAILSGNRTTSQQNCLIVNS